MGRNYGVSQQWNTMQLYKGIRRVFNSDMERSLHCEKIKVHIGALVSYLYNMG